MKIAFRMSVHEGKEETSRQRHNPIWPELTETLLQHGVKTYSIFLDPVSNDLFAYAEIESMEKWQSIAETEICKKWWRYMQPLMPANPDCSPVSQELEQVFHIEKD